MICEKCWRDAGLRAIVCGGSQSDHYEDILEERKDRPCTKEEQEGSEPRTAVANARKAGVVK